MLSLLPAYQAELCGEFGFRPVIPRCWRTFPAVTDLCLRAHISVVQVMGKIMATAGTLMLAEPRGPDRLWGDLLLAPVVPEGIFGSPLASMSRRCEAKKKEDEALKLCPFPVLGGGGHWKGCVPSYRVRVLC